MIEEDKLAKCELLEQELEWYKEAYSELDGLVDKLKDSFLGTNWYITDPVNNRQANEIIIEEIIRKFAPRKKEKSQLRKWLDRR
jgi:hypothetical protein